MGTNTRDRWIMGETTMCENATLIKIFNRLQIMYSNCRALSNDLILINDRGLFRLFKVSSSGAKELDTGYELQVYSDIGVIAIGDSRELRIYNFSGAAITDKPCEALYYVAGNVMGILGGNAGQVKLIKNTGEQLELGIPITATNGYTNGIIQISSFGKRSLYSTVSNKFMMVDCITKAIDTDGVKRSKAVSLGSISIKQNCIYIHGLSIGNRMAGAVYDIRLNKCANIIRVEQDTVLIEGIGAMKMDKAAIEIPSFIGSRLASTADIWNGIQSII